MTRRTSRTSPAPDRLAVTKALTAVDPDHPELVAARDAGIAASSRGSRSSRTRPRGGRWSPSPARTASPRPRAGWSTSWWPPGADPRAFVGALLPPRITGGPPRPRDGDGTGVRRRGGRVRRQLRPVPPGRRGPDSRRVGSPGRVRGRGRGRSPRSRRGSRARRPERSRRRERGRRGRAPRSLDAWRTGPAGSSRRRSSTAPSGRGRAGERRPRRPTITARAEPRPARPSRSTAWTAPGRLVTVRLATRAATTPPTPSPSPARPRRRASTPEAILRASRRSPAWGAGWSARARPGVVVYDDYAHHPTAIAETSRPSAARPRPAPVGRLRAAHVSPDGRDARRVRGGARRRRMRSPWPTSGPAATRTPRSPPPGRSPTRRRPTRPAMTAVAPGASRRPPTGCHARSMAGDGSWSWAGPKLSHRRAVAGALTVEERR